MYCFDMYKSLIFLCYYDLQQILLPKLSHELMFQQPQFDKIIQK
jgi:hypothetical protein